MVGPVRVLDKTRRQRRGRMRSGVGIRRGGRLRFLRGGVGQRQRNKRYKGGTLTELVLYDMLLRENTRFVSVKPVFFLWAAAPLVPLV